MDIDYDYTSVELRRRAKFVLEEKGLSPNLKTLEVSTVPPFSLTLGQLQAIFSVFGEIKEAKIEDDLGIITFSHTAGAFLAKETLNEVDIEEMGIKLKIDWKDVKSTEESNKRFEVPDTFVPLPSLDIDDTPCLVAGPLKYVAKFPINIIEESGFHLKEKILGAKGCNFRKIVEICARGSHLPEKPKHLVSLKLEKKEGIFQIILSSKFLDKFQQCENLVYELVNVIYEEYKRYCEKQGTSPPDLRVRKVEQIKGRARAFREGIKDPSIYTISNHN
ncbi:unnamed protein product [Blepharisma stoltei]|uniref:RRM domain-containing protein n=1 Tax=Blepharisma stoltei TaxID=1481888 RepID=A0AAU9K9V6_9CILI|nr:unnamed protein product [Blepharisma stoltei]